MRAMVHNALGSGIINEGLVVGPSFHQFAFGCLCVVLHRLMCLPCELNDNI